MTDSLSKSEWTSRLQPALDRSVTEANETITNTASVQRWLRSASMEAASGLSGMTDMQAQMQAYRRLMDALANDHPGLFEAVHELTLGCARLEMDWRPLSPQYSSIYLEFDAGVKVHFFWTLSSSEPAVVQEKLALMEDALPAGEAFPGHPKEVGAVLARKHICLTVVLKEKANKGGAARRGYSLFAPDYEPVEDISKHDAIRGVSDFFERELQ